MEEEEEGWASRPWSKHASQAQLKRTQTERGGREVLLGGSTVDPRRRRSCVDSKGVDGGVSEVSAIVACTDGG